LGGVGSTKEKADEGGGTWEPAYSRYSGTSPIEMESETPHPAIGIPTSGFVPPVYSCASQLKLSASLHDFVHGELCTVDLIR
jgi:hypothetical protein